VIGALISDRFVLSVRNGCSWVINCVHRIVLSDRCSNK
jgi:hypothetical protein